MKSCLLFDSNYPSKSFVVMKLVFWVISSPDVKMNLLPQSSQWNPVCSLIQIYSSNWLCGDETSLVSNLKSRCQIEPFAAVLRMKSCFSLIHENSFKDLWCFPWVFLFNLKFQYQYLIFFFRYLPVSIPRKTSLKDDFVVMIHGLDFQVQMSNWTACHRPNTWILFALWFKTNLQYDSVDDNSFPALSSPDFKLNLLSQWKRMNPVSSLIQHYFAVWLCGDNSCPGLSSPDVKLNLLSQAKHINPVSSLIQN